MKIGIVDEHCGFSESWIKYCRERGIPYRTLDVTSSDVIHQAEECDLVLWHWRHDSAQSPLFARQLLYSWEVAGKMMFPDFHTGWHFDDKVGQKYLLEAVGAPLVPSYVFYDYHQAQEWIARTKFPKVFKLRRGAGAVNVRLVRTPQDALSLARRMFGSGISCFDQWSYFKDTLRKWRKRMVPIAKLVNAFAHLLVKPGFARMFGSEKGYLYFQDFIPKNSYDIRIIVIGERAIAIKRYCRANDFRASGSGIIEYPNGTEERRCAEIAFETVKKIQTQSCAFDFVFRDGKPLIVELSYAFTEKAYRKCLGYWDSALQWHNAAVEPAVWMLEDLLARQKM